MTKHGTCINTIKPDCYTNYTKYDEMIDYIQIVVELFKDNPTYEVSAHARTPNPCLLYLEPSKLKISMLDTIGSRYHPL